MYFYCSFMKNEKFEKLKQNFAVKKTSYGRGLFTKKPIQKGAFVIEYTGEKITVEEGDRRGGKYLMTLSDKHTIDGKGHENLARYINHSCKSNCVPQIIRGHVKIYARKNIRVGEELNYNYGKQYWNCYIKPYGCKCNACLKK
jgi:SET domain-containing protein